MATVILVLLVIDIIATFIFNIKLKRLEDIDEIGTTAILVKYERKIHELQMALMSKKLHLEEAKKLIEKYEADILAKNVESDLLAMKNDAECDKARLVHANERPSDKCRALSLENKRLVTKIEMYEKFIDLLKSNDNKIEDFYNFALMYNGELYRTNNWTIEANNITEKLLHITLKCID
jgi:hypothetical protein